jgi:hypothetical protein
MIRPEPEKKAIVVLEFNGENSNYNKSKIKFKTDQYII